MSEMSKEIVASVKAGNLITVCSVGIDKYENITKEVANHLLKDEMGGVYIKKRKKMVFKKVGLLTNYDLSDLLAKVHKRIVRLLLRLGYLKEDPKVPTCYEQSPFVH